MATEGEPGDLVKVFYLLVLSFSWGMQVWVSFIAGFTLVKSVSLHTFGLVQSKLFPVYFHCVLGCSVLSLSVFSVFHPRELMDWHEGLQMFLYLLVLVLSAVNARWLGPSSTEVLQRLQEVEKEHGLGEEVGLRSSREEYTKLREKDPKYRSLKASFGRYHGLTQGLNLIGFICTTTNLVYTALNLSTL